MSFWSVIKTSAQSFGQALFPEGIVCLSCGGELDGTTGNHLCGACWIEFNKNFCARCGRKMAGLSEFCEACTGRGGYQFDAARSVAVFNETAQKLIYAFKYGGAKYLAGFMAGFMAETVKTQGIAADAVAFVPLHKKRRRKRGYNQSELLAKELSKLTGIPSLPLLEKVKHTKNLAKLNRAGRAEAIRDSIAFCGGKDSLKGQKILLVDDVLTTGATADECAKVLKGAGAERITVLTFASVEIKPILL